MTDPALNASTMSHLAFVRMLYQQGVEQARRPEPLSYASLLSFHDSVELERQTIGTYLALSQRAYAILCSASHTLTIHYTSGLIAEVPPEDRELVR
jgi:hypothetical protein